MKNKINVVKGTRDFYPEDMSFRSWLYEIIKDISTLFGYQEYEGPLLEPLELYAAKSGDELVKEQAFVFPDRGGDMIALRPELTPTLARMVAQRQNQLIFPLRWWSFGPFWRYERPQKGRSREFFQWNIDLIGVNSVQADLEMISIISKLFSHIGLTPEHVRIFINDRKLMENELLKLDFSINQLPEIFKLIDRKDKLAQAEWISYGSTMGLIPSQIRGLESLLENKHLWEHSDGLSSLFDMLNKITCYEYVQYDSSIIRGLDYYTGIVFEAKEITGSVRRSILGGGRYDNLLADVGGSSLPAIGFAMGDMVMSLVIKNHNLAPSTLSQIPAQVLVTIFNQDFTTSSIQLAATLRENKINACLYPEAISLNKQLKYADRVGIRFAVILGPDESEKNLVVIKDMTNGSQYSINKSDLSAKIKRLLDLPVYS